MDEQQRNDICMYMYLIALIIWFDDYVCKDDYARMNILLLENIKIMTNTIIEIRITFGISEYHPGHTAQ